MQMSNETAPSDQATVRSYLEERGSSKVLMNEVCSTTGLTPSAVMSALEDTDAQVMLDGTWIKVPGEWR
jgi:hypothetical protein